MPIKEEIEKLKKLNLSMNDELSKESNKILKYLSMFLRSFLFGYFIMGVLVILAAFFTPWLAAAFTFISTLALPLLIPVAIITMAVLLSPIATFLWKKHQVKSKLKNSFEHLEKNLNSLKGKNDNENENDELAKYQLRQALFVYDYLNAENCPDHTQINLLLQKHSIKVEWIFIVDLIQKDLKVPSNTHELEKLTNITYTDYSSEEVHSALTFILAQHQNGKTLVLDEITKMNNHLLKQLQTDSPTSPIAIAPNGSTNSQPQSCQNSANPSFHKPYTENTNNNKVNPRPSSLNL